VSGVSNALYLQAPFTSLIRLNDFLSYSTAIRTSNDLASLTDIAADQGNYWGLPCPGFDPAHVRFDNGTVNPFVFDGRPYGESVALTPDKKLPPGCQ